MNEPPFCKQKVRKLIEVVLFNFNDMQYFIFMNDKTAQNNSQPTKIFTKLSMQIKNIIRALSEPAVMQLIKNLKNKIKLEDLIPLLENFREEISQHNDINRDKASVLLDTINNFKPELNGRMKLKNIKKYLTGLRETNGLLTKAFNDKKETNDELMRSLDICYSTLVDLVSLKRKNTITLNEIKTIRDNFSLFINLHVQGYGQLKMRGLHWKEKHLAYKTHIERNINELQSLLEIKDKLTQIQENIINVMNNKLDCNEAIIAPLVFTKREPMDINSDEASTLVEVCQTQATKEEKEMMEKRIQSLSSVSEQFNKHKKPYETISELEKTNQELLEQSQDGWVTSEHYQALKNREEELENSINEIKQKIKAAKSQLRQLERENQSMQKPINNSPRREKKVLSVKPR